ncbi:thermonuclease family protein [Phaeovibrio sulfidiphilus]|uniref:Thermonuclease family protein n=1 Tax=Phaeovibrio sulfidiphilus TaxID=1220600 RepID=A0A8J6YL31_9PROT|nr:thermonuclease family protein [Phaeovibrio sulfidiphilus]MBE1236655.1 thermonuclease family protein [Phaeovibrio sulfidiphilus]
MNRLLRSRSVPFAGVLVTVCLSAGLTAAAPTSRAVPVEGPIRGEVVRVIDGDTLEVEAFVWPDHRVTASVRVEGIDTPELRGRCDAEKEMARRARDYVIALLDHHGSTVLLKKVRHDKYAGRVLASVLLPGDIDLAGTLIAEGLARPYDGKTRGSWCEPQDTALNNH